MRWVLFGLMVIHGLIHFMGPAKAFGLADLPQLAQPIPRAWGVVWLAAGLTMLAAAVLLLATSGAWRVAALTAVVLSQAAIIASWGDARFGTLANLLVLVGLALPGFWSQGEPRPVLNGNGARLAGSISEKIHVTINGAEQGMFLRSADTTHPVLLFLHGGPGMPTYFLERRYPTGLEADFTVCWWEQRGTGLSYAAGFAPETMTAAQLVVDAVAVADYLRHRFGKEKIYLMGHSWGSFIGIQAAAQAPDRFHAYIGVGQISHQVVSERRAYDHMLDEFRARGNVAMVRELEAASFGMTPPLPEAYMRLRDRAMHTLGVGTTREMRSVVSGIFLPVWQNGEYTLRERMNVWRGKWSPSSRHLWNEMLGTDLAEELPRLDIPVYFLHGRHDYTVSYVQAKAYLQHLEAPIKGFYTYGGSAHSPHHEEPERTRVILMRDVLAGRTALSDGGRRSGGSGDRLSPKEAR